MLISVFFLSFFQYFKYQLLHAFDHIRMEKAGYKFLISIIMKALGDS